MSIDSIATNIQNYQSQPARSVSRAFNTDGSAAGSSSAPAGTSSRSAPASGSLQNMSSDLQNILLQLQSSSGSGTAEAGNPAQAAKGVRSHNPHHHGGTQQAGGTGTTQSGAVAQSAASAVSVLSAG